MEVGPTCHYMMGGIRVDAETGATAASPGLFAAGECAGGLHGANRLGGNSLSDLLVFGRRAGEARRPTHAPEASGAAIDDGEVAAAAAELRRAPRARAATRTRTRSTRSSRRRCSGTSASTATRPG